MKKEAYEFRRDIVSGALNPRSGKIVAEKILKYFEDKLKAKVDRVLYLSIYTLNMCILIMSVYSIYLWIRKTW